MPNARSAEKRPLRCWLSAELYTRLSIAAEALNLPLSALVTAALLAYLPPRKPAEREE